MQMFLVMECKQNMKFSIATDIIFSTIIIEPVRIF